MRSFLGFLKNLVLPFGATTGARIELIGTGPNAGQIDIYNSAGVRVLTLSATAEGMRILPDDLNGLDTMSLEADVAGHAVLFLGRAGVSPIVIPGRIDLLALGSRTVATRIASPMDDGSADQATFLMASEDVSAGLPPIFFFRDENGGSPVDLLQIIGGSSTADVMFDDPSSSIPPLSLARGLVATTGNIGANEGPYTVPTQSTSLVLNNMPTVSGRKYLFVIGGVAQLDPNVGSWQLELTINGSVIGNMTRLTNQVAGTFRHPTTSFMQYVAGSTGNTDDFGVFLDERTGTADLTLIGGATLASPPMFMECYDMGAP